VQRHGCYQPTPMGNTPYGHSTFITELLTWVHGRMGLVALHERVQTTTTTLDGKTFTAYNIRKIIIIKKRKQVLFRYAI
jgi:hypothetical protein